MWLLKEIYYHRREHYLSMLAQTTAVFLLLMVSVMCDSGEALLKGQVSKLGLDVTLTQITDASALPVNWEREFVRRYGIKQFCRYRSVPFEKLQIVSCDSGLKELFSLEMDKGSFLDECDAFYNADKAVLGHTSWEELGRPGIGDLICLDGVSFKVTGVLKEYSENLFVDLDNSIFIPSGYRFSQRPESISYYFRCGDHYVEDWLQETLGHDNCLIISQQGMAEAIDSIFRGVRGILSVISAVSVVVAFMGLINSSLNNVRKRSYEIGIKKSLGASDRDIYRQFILEGIFIIASSVIMALRGVAGVMAIMPQELRVFNASRCVAIIFKVMAAGLVCSLYPAIKASRTTVIGSLRGKQ